YVIVIVRFLSTEPASSVTSILSLHDALPICCSFEFAVGCHWAKTALARLRLRFELLPPDLVVGLPKNVSQPLLCPAAEVDRHGRDRKSTRLNSSHVKISYAVFCLKKKQNRAR